MNNSQRGFIVSLLLVLVAVLLVGGGVYAYMQTQKGGQSTTDQTARPLSEAQMRDNDVQRVTDMAQVMGALTSYYTQNKSCPDTLTALVPTYISAMPTLPSRGETFQYAYTQDKFNCHLGVTLEVADPSLFYDIGRTGVAPWKGCNSSIDNGCFSTVATNGFDGTNPKMYNKIIREADYGALFVSKQNSVTFSATVIDSGFTNIKMDRGTFQSVSPTNLTSAIEKGILYTTDATDFLQFNSSRPHGTSDYLPLGKVKIDGYLDTVIGNGIITRVEQLKN